MPQPTSKRLVTEAAVAGHVNTEVTTPGSATAVAVSASISAQVAPVSAKVMGRARAADGIFAAVSESLNSGRSACMQLQGDSTGNADYEWFRLITNWLGSQHSTAHVKYKVWNDTSQAYDAWTTVQAGASGERHALFVPTWARSHYVPQAAIPHIGGDIDVRARVSLDNWAAGATQTLVARYGSAGFHAWKMEITTGNLLNFAWSTDGTTDITKVSSTAPAFTAGQEGWVRCTLDVDNGLGGYSWKGYTSTDGVTWTEIGSSVTTSGGATSIFDAPQEYEIGARGQTGGNIEGKIYEVQIRDGVGGKIVSPQPIDAWVPRAASGSYVPGTFGGSPTLYVLNGSHPGAAYTYFSDATRHPKMVHPYAGSLAFQSCSHNDSENIGHLYLASRKTWLDLTDARAAGSQVVLVTQNPEVAPISAHSIACHARRRNLLMAWGARNGLAVIDTYKAFQDSAGGVAALLETDGIHPNATGSQVWADTVTAAFDAA